MNLPFNRAEEANMQVVAGGVINDGVIETPNNCKHENDSLSQCSCDVMFILASSKRFVQIFMFMFEMEYLLVSVSRLRSY